jgi:spermidine synthase
VAWPRPVPAQRWALGGASLAAVVAIALAPPWNVRVMTSGPAIYRNAYLGIPSGVSLADALSQRQVLFHRDGPSATVAVTRDGDTVTLRINGKADASTTREDVPTQFMGGHLPLLLHPDPRRVLVIGLGSGISAGAVARYPVERLDVVEIEPAVVQASRFFTGLSGDFLGDPRVHLVIADGRNFLRTTPERYDVIISEPSNPWIGGIATLFTVEAFEAARQRLRPGGLMVQWAQAYSLAPADLQMIVKTFSAVFPGATVWHVSTADYLFLGWTDPGPLDLGVTRARYGIPAVARDLTRIGIRDWPGILGDFMLNGADASRYAAGARLNTDDRLPLEFSAPRALYADTVFANWQAMERVKTVELPELTPDSRAAVETAGARYAIGMTHLARRVLPEALSQFQRAVELDPAYTPARLEAGRVSLRLGRPSDALGFARQALAREPRNAQALLVAGLASLALKTPVEAVAFLQEAATLEPQNEEIRQALATARIKP